MVQLMQYALLQQKHSISLTHKCVAAKVIKCTFFGFGIDFCEEKNTNSTFTMDLAQDFKRSFCVCALFIAFHLHRICFQWPFYLFVFVFDSSFSYAKHSFIYFFCGNQFESVILQTVTHFICINSNVVHKYFLWIFILCAKHLLHINRKTNAQNCSKWI